MKTPMTKLMLAAFVATLLCLGARAAEIDISTISSSGYTACDGDVFYGTQSNRYPIDIPDGVTVTLAGINYSDTIHCMGDAVIILKDDTENVIRPGNPWPAIELWNYGKTLTIRGEGKLLAYGNGHNAGIGPCSPDHGWNRGEGGNIVIEGGDITAEGGAGGAGIGASANNNCGNITIRGGKVMATGHSACGIGNSASGTCGDLTIEGTIEKVVVTGATAGTGVEIASGGALTIGSEDHKLIWWSDDDVTCTIGPKGSLTDEVECAGLDVLSGGETVTIWADVDVTAPDGDVTVPEGSTTIIDSGAFAMNDWTAADGDTITGETTHKVTIPGGATVTINGVAVASGGGGASVDSPSFSDSGESTVTKLEGAGNTWTLTAFAEMEGDSVGTTVTDGQIKVYAADSVEGLKDAEPVYEGVTVTERKSAVKTKIEVVLPSTPEKQFFKVKFGE